MRRAIDAFAVVASLVTLLILGGGGGALLAVDVSGERGAGALLAFCGLVSFALTVLLACAGGERFREPVWRGAAVVAAIIAALPVAGLGAAALRFAGLPIRSPIPLVDWPVFAVGLLLIAGGIAILALGVRRARQPAAEDTPWEDEADDDESAIIHMQQIRDAQRQLRTALRRAESEPVSYSDDGDIRVRRV